MDGLKMGIDRLNRQEPRHQGPKTTEQQVTVGGAGSQNQRLPEEWMEHSDELKQLNAKVKKM